MLKALIADDDPVIILLLRKILSELNFEVVSCSDGNTAFDLIIKEPIPDLAIIDWHMPGMTGLEVSNKHESLNDSYSTYKILLSGVVGKEEMISALHNGFHDIILKPIDRTILNTRISVANKIITEKKSLSEMNSVINRYAHQMESLANERAKQLIHADRMSSLGVMYAGISHEINNPMSFISGNAQHISLIWQHIEPIIKQYIQSDASPTVAEKNKLTSICEEMPKIISSIMNGVERVTSIVKSLKRFSSTNSTHQKKFDLNSCIIQALELNKFSTSKVKVLKQLDSEELLVSGNPVELEQVITNLIINSIHALENIQNPQIAISPKRSNSNLSITVEDNGCGIPESVMNKIWDPFFTTKPIGKGTGLGLAISSGIIRDHGGSITAVNKQSGGSIFTITLPSIK